MEIPELRHLKIIGDISVEPVITRIPKDSWPYIYLSVIIGPTGAGKSSFIEAFEGKLKNLSISKDQLAGYTRAVTAYRLVNVLHREYNPPSPVYLIDTPGFSDSKIAEIEILEMVKKWSLDNEDAISSYLDWKTQLIRSNSFYYSGSILYLTPITETRLPRSRRRTFQMLEKLMEMHRFSTSLIIITTMWDTVHNKQTRNRAESNFVQLKDEILKEFLNNPSTDVIKFTNTRKSALLAIDRRASTSSVFNEYSTSTSPLLYQDLDERIQNALQERQMIELDLAQPDAQTNANLRAILKNNQRDNHKTLTKFINQFINFGKLPPGCRDAAFHLRKSIAANTRPENIKHRVLFLKWAREPDVIESNDCGQSSPPLGLKDIGHFAVNASKRRVEEVFKHGK
ncbi:hypothetical protein BJ165DRAFT_1534975 [Panaeolus papilionaceus]|nr:hypothetical protein BJ165DRAFT_1534975 [Panaeolus papilionaceus]